MNSFHVRHPSEWNSHLPAEAACLWSRVCLSPKKRFSTKCLWCRGCKTLKSGCFSIWWEARTFWTEWEVSRRNSDCLALVQSSAPRSNETSPVLGQMTFTGRVGFSGTGLSHGLQPESQADRPLSAPLWISEFAYLLNSLLTNRKVERWHILFSKLTIQREEQKQIQCLPISLSGPSPLPHWDSFSQWKLQC